MKIIEPHKPVLSLSLLWLMTIATGIVVGNNYYNQPLLGLMAKDFRVAAGVVGELWGWRAIYYIAIGFMLILMMLIAIKLPDIRPNFKGNYGQLMRSLIHLTRTQPVLRLSAFRGALGFAGFSAFWITLVFHLEGAPFHAGSAVAGSFGLIGAVGALAASVVGRIAKYVSNYRIILVSIWILFASWIVFYFGGFTYAGLIFGVILIDLGLQSMHISNQSSYFALNIGAANRLNTVYMFSYFVGGSFGTYMASLAWKYFQWNGVVATGMICTLLLLIVHVSYGKKN